jgi:hypothetical protein
MKRNLPPFSILRLIFLPLFSLSGAATAFSQVETCYTYSVSVPQEYATKEVLASVTVGLPVMHQYVVGSGFRFTLPMPMDIHQKLEELGIPHELVSGDKETHPIPYEEKAGGTDCETAQQLCSNTSQSGNSSGFGIQELNAINRGCLASNEHQSSWYYLNVQTAGNLTLLIDPAINSTDYDFAIWGPYTAATANANCPPVTGPVRCSYYNNANGSGNTGLSGTVLAQGTSEGTTGDGFVGELTALAGQVYILLVDNFTASSTSYALSFGGSAILGCTPIVLPVELSEFTGVRVNDDNLLRWTTETEFDSKEFVIEWSCDPLSGVWQPVATVDAQVHSSVQTHYSAVHTSPHRNKINYYRVVQRNQDGYEHTYHEKMVAIDNTDHRQIVRIVDLMGRDAASDTKGVVIYIYADGSKEKVFQ